MYICIYIATGGSREAGAVGRADSAPLKEDKRARPVFSQEKRVKDLNFKKTIM